MKIVDSGKYALLVSRAYWIQVRLDRGPTDNREVLLAYFIADPTLDMIVIQKEKNLGLVCKSHVVEAA